MLPCSLFRRVLALIYDSLIVIALLMLATAILFFFTRKPLYPEDGLFHTLFQFYLLSIILGYFIGFWHFGGQTIGMKAWKIRLLDKSSLMPPSFSQSAFRMLSILISPLWGILPALWRQDNRTWYDKVSKTVMIKVPLARPAQNNGAHEPK